MYLIFPLLFGVLFIFFCFGFFRRKKIIKKVCSMCANEKCALLNELLEPFGYSYCRPQDLISSRLDAWQKDFGYTHIYDKLAYKLDIVFDCLPVYFNYDNKTWLIEFWKGQYGICAGCEVGIYCSNKIVSEDERENTVFFAVPECQMPLISFRLYKGEKLLANLSEYHWWLTAFLPGKFANPGDLSMDVCLTFANAKLAGGFSEGLKNAGYRCHDICTGCNSVSFFITDDFPEVKGFKRFIIRLVQFKNKCGACLYRRITKPFIRTDDRILYLYYFLPRAFRRILNTRKKKKCRKGAHRIQ